MSVNKMMGWFRGLRDGHQPKLNGAINAAKKGGQGVVDSAKGLHKGHGGMSGILGLGQLQSGMNNLTGAIQGAHGIAQTRREALATVRGQGLTGKKLSAAEDAARAANNPFEPIQNAMWAAPGGIANWVTAADLGKDATTAQRWMAGGLRTVGGVAAADFLNPFSLGWND